VCGSYTAGSSSTNPIAWNGVCYYHSYSSSSNCHATWFGGNRFCVCEENDDSPPPPPPPPAPPPPSPPQAVLQIADTQCQTQAANLGTYSDPTSCLNDAVASASCPSNPDVMFSSNYNSWGCRCCASGASNGNSNANWDIFRLPASRRLSTERRLLFDGEAQNDGLESLLTELLMALPEALLADDMFQNENEL